MGLNMIQFAGILSQLASFNHHHEANIGTSGHLTRQPLHQEMPYGWYVPSGEGNNAKVQSKPLPQNASGEPRLSL